MTDSTGTNIIYDVTSPFCGIVSDDLVVEVTGDTVKVKENGDAISTPGFETAITDKTPRIKGKDVSLDEAVSYIVQLLHNSKQPLIGGMATDINGTRAAMAVADASRATIDSYGSDGAFRNLLVLQDSGYMTSSLSEVRNRVDVLLVVGSDIEAAYPRFFERFIWSENALVEQSLESREVIFLGKQPSGDAANSTTGKQAHVLPCDGKQLPEVVSVLRALINGKVVQADTVGGVKVADLQQLADKLNQAKHSVVTWSADQLDFDHAEITVQNLCEMIKDLNLKTRSNALALGGKNGDATVNAVATWQSGFPMRTSFNRNMPQYDPVLYRGQRMLDNNEVDLLLWVSSFDTQTLPPQSTATTVVLGRSGMTFEQEPEVFIPVGVPGIDHHGRTLRCDNVVSMPLYQLRDSGLPSVFDVLTAVEKAL